MNKEKICHLTSVHKLLEPRIFYKECLSLKSAGYDVVLVGPHQESETVDGIRLHAVKLPKNRKERLLITVWLVYAAALAENADCYHFHDPELFIIGLLLKIKGKRVIYDVHEDVRLQVLVKEWIPRPLRKIVSLFWALTETVVTGFFDGIVAATPPIAKRFPRKCVVTVQNFPEPFISTNEDETHYSKRKRLVAYVGQICAIRGLGEMVNAIGRLPEHLDAKLILIGDAESKVLEEIEKSAGWNRTDYTGWKSPKEVRELLKQCMVGLSVLHPAKNYLESYPTKIFEYMQFEIPIIASDFPLWRTIIEEAGCGLLVNPMVPEEIGRAIQWLLEHPEEALEMGKRGKKAVSERYNWPRESEKLLNFYTKILRA